MYEAVNEVRRIIISSFVKGRPPQKLRVDAQLYARMHAEVKKHQSDFGACVMYRFEDKNFIIDGAPDAYPGVLLMNVSIWPKTAIAVAA